MTLQKKYSLRRKFVPLFLLSVIVPVFVITIILISLGYFAIKKALCEHQQELLSRVVDRIYSAVEQTKQVVVHFASQDIIDKKNYVNQILLMNRNLIEVVLIDAKGQEIIKAYRQNNKIIYNKKLFNRYKREEFTKASHSQVYISPINFSAERKPYMLFSTKLYNKESVLLVKMDLLSLWETISEIRIGETGYAFVVDKRGRLLAHPEINRVLAHADFTGLPIVREILSGKNESSWKIYHDERKQTIVTFHKVIPELSWAVITQVPYREIIQPIKQMLLQAILWVIIFTAVFVFIGIIRLQRVIAPLKQLQRSVKQIAAGKFDIHLEIHSNDELEDLATTFNHMVHSLKQLEQLRQDLIHMIIHDMKSPLSSIIASLEYITTHNITSDEQKQILSIAQKATDSLYTMVQNLLDVARMEEGKLKLNLSSVPIKEFLLTAVEQFKIQAISENKTLEVKLSPYIPEKINLDKNLILRVLNNLLTNALQHTTSGGVILFTVGNTNDSNIEIAITDDGVGVPEEYKDKIFEKFVHVERKMAHLRTGTGLGLTFCKMAVELHRGKIWVESEHGKGSKFAFTLPI